MDIKLSVLVDNNTLIDRYFRGEPGVSYFIESDEQRILFDVGYSGLFLENARKMDIDLLDLDYLVFSHSHLDHTWGFPHLIKLYAEAIIEEKTYINPELVTHPETFADRSLGKLGQIGSIISREKAADFFDMNLSKKPVWLTDRLVFLGEIPRKNDFEARSSIGRVSVDGEIQDDYIREDSALVYKSEKGLVIITGCSHAGICNIIEQARQVTGEEHVYDIIGGLHLQEPSDRQLQGTLDYLERLAPARVHACHCTDLKSKIALSKVVNLQEVGVGLEIEG